MGFGTYVKPSYVYYSHEDLSSSDKCDTKRAELYEDIERIKREIVMMCASRPDDYVPCDCEGNRFENLEYINFKIPQLFDELEDIYRNIERLCIIEDNLDTVKVG